MVFFYDSYAKVSMYQTRHTFATLMLSAGENPNWVAKIMGHASVEMLFKKKQIHT